ncbi:hypothetical protein ACOSQ2_013563 [Xanthoceras sorbifolium]
MVGVGCVVASAFAGWTCFGSSDTGVTVRATVDSVGSCPARVFRFRSPAVNPSSKIRCRALEVSIASVACPGTDVRLALNSYQTCPNSGGGVVVIVSDSTLV